MPYSAQDNQAGNVTLLNSFYGIFLFTGLALLTIGVPFVFLRKVACAVVLLLLIGAVLFSWHLSRRGKPQASIMLFASLMWLLVVPLVFFGLKSSSFAVLLGIAVMLTVVVSLRVGIIYCAGYMLCWLAYLSLSANGLAPEPYFRDNPGASWFIGIISIWLVLLPITRLIKGQRRALEVLQVSESRLQMALAAVSDGVWDYDLRSGEVFRSPLYYALVGRRPEENAGDFAFFTSLVYPEDLPAVLASIEAHRQGRTPAIQIDFRLAASGDTPRWLRARGRAVERAADGAPLRVVGTLSDITERKQIDEALRDNERRLSRVIHGSDQGFWEWDLVDDIFTVSERFETMLGYQPGEMRPPAKDWGLYVQADDLARSLALVKEHLAGRSPSLEADIRCRAKTGEWRWMLTRGSVVERAADGSPLRMSGTHTDITERKRLEAELELHRSHLEKLVEERTAALTVAKDAAESANRAKSTFLAKMSHELRTPMNGIMGMTDLARRRASDAVQKDYLDKARQSSLHLLAVINDILDISKIEADRLTLEQTDFHLASVLDNIANFSEGRARQQGLDFRIEIAPALRELPLKGDPLRLVQVLLNLTGNALKFTARGSVAVLVRLIEESPEGIELRFEVRDTGIGIAVEQQGRLFTAFEQADNSITRKYGGSGLGLAISKSLVGMMGGEIGVDSRPGEGSTVWFTVRLQRSEQVGAGRPQVDVQATAESLLMCHAGARILLVEDEPINREVAQEQLEEVGLLVDLAENGDEAVALVKENDYDLVLMDMQMPVMDGLEATRVIRRLPGRQNLPIVAMTANAFAEDRERCLAAGMDDFLAKPVKPEQLFQTLLHWLDRQAPGAAD